MTTPQPNQCNLEFCSQHSGVKATVDSVRASIDRIEKKIDTHYPRELVYILSLAGTIIGVLATLVASWR